jgi:uncharacterized repeat protein (TIGR03837 family)
MGSSPRWDIFCNVVDHFGDIAVSWRLARQLQAEYGMAVRLFVDDLVTFHALRAAVDPGAAVQAVDGIDVHHWTPDLFVEEVGDVVIDAFGSRAPDQVLEAMARRSRAPVWINLEYLSAESWVEDCHRLASPHPRLPLVRHFFFPGFTAATGGLLEERSLAAERAAFLGDPAARDASLRHWGVRPPAREEARVVTLFGYGGPSVPSLLRAWAEGDDPVCALVPMSRLTPDVARFLGREGLNPGDVASVGCLEIQMLPFGSQADYDRLLWMADFNFVRGEDSFVRAQWAESPFVWNIYPQEGGAHWAKMHAFIDRYGIGLEPEVVAALRAFWRLWNRGEGSPAILGAAWRRFRSYAEELRVHNAAWAAHLRSHQDLAANLVRFAVEKL